MKRGLIPVLIIGGVVLTVSAATRLATVTSTGQTPLGKPQIEIEHHGIKLNPSNRLNYSAEQLQLMAMHRQNTQARANAKARIAATPTYADMPLLYGFHYRTDDWTTVSTMPSGIYSFHPGEIISYYEEAVPGPEQGMTSFYAKGKYYVLTSSLAEDYMTVNATITEYDANTWEVLRGPEKVGNGDWDYYFRQIGIYDPVTNKAYTMSWGDGKPLLSIDLTTLEFTKLGEVNKFIQVLFLDKDNNLYGIDFNDNALYAIDKTNGSTSLVGALDLDFKINADQMSAVTDPVSGITYWTAVNWDNKKSYLTTIDLATAHCTIISELPEDEHFLSLYIPYVEADAPGATTNNKYADRHHRLQQRHKRMGTPLIHDADWCQ